MTNYFRSTCINVCLFVAVCCYDLIGIHWNRILQLGGRHCVYEAAIQRFASR